MPYFKATLSTPFNGTIIFPDSTGNTAKIQANTTINESYTLTLPDTNGNSGQYLRTDGNGILSWATVSGGGSVLADEVQRGDSEVYFGTSFGDARISAASGGSVDLEVANTDVAVVTSTGMAITGVLSASGIINADDTTQTTTIGEGAIIVDGGASIAKNLVVGGNITLTGSNIIVANGYEPITDNGGALGSASKQFSDLYLAAGATINSNSGSVILTEGANVITVTGGNLALGSSSFLKLQDDSGDAITIRANTAIDAAYTLTLPNNDGITGQVLTTNGNGNLSWTNVAGSVAADDITAGDAEVQITTTTGDIRINAPTGQTVDLEVNGTDIAVVSATGVDVIGNITATAAVTPSTNDAAPLGTESLAWSDLFLADGSVINFSNGDVTLTHSANTLTVAGGNVLLDSTQQLQFRDSTEYINSSVDGQLDIVASDEIQLTSTRSNISGGLYVSGQVLAESLTESSSTTTGSLVTSGGLGVTGNVHIGGNTYINDGLFPSINDGASIGSSVLNWSDLFLADGSAINFSNGDVILTHSANTLTIAGGNVLLDSTQQLQFRDSTEYINSSVDGQLDIVASDEIQLTSTRSNVSGSLYVTGQVLAESLTESSSTTTGSLVTSGGLGVAANVHIGGSTYINNGLFPSINDGASIGSSTLNWSDLFLADGSVINFSNGDVTLTHSANTLTIAGGNVLLDSAQQLQFRDSTEYINSSVDGQLDIVASNEIQLTATRSNVSGSLYVTGQVLAESLTESSSSTTGSLVTSGGLGVAANVHIGGSTYINDGLFPSINDGAAIGSSTLNWSDLFLADGSAINFSNGDVTLTHSANTLAIAGGNLLISTTQQLQFRDSTEYINSSVDGQLDIVASDEIQLTSTRSNVSGSLYVTGQVLAESTTESSSSTTGSLVTSGGLGVAANIHVGGSTYINDGLFPSINDGAAIGSSTLNWSDLFLADGSVINFSNGDVTLTHSANTLAIAGGNVLLDSTQQLQFRDSTEYINSSVDGQLDIVASDEIQLTSTRSNISGSLYVTGQVLAESTTESSSTTTGSLITSGGLGVAGNVHVGGNVYISKNTIINEDSQLQFRDNGIFINSSVDGQLDIDADVEIEIAAPTVDINASTELDITTPILDINVSTTDVSGDINIEGTITSNGGVTVSNNININSLLFMGVNNFDENAGTGLDLFDSSNNSPVKHIKVSGSSSTTNISVQCLSSNVSDGAMAILFYTDDGDGTANANIDFGTGGLYGGLGAARYLFFDQSGQSATLIYLNSGSESGWRIINVGGQVF